MPRAHRCIRLSLLTGMIYCVSFLLRHTFARVEMSTLGAKTFLHAEASKSDRLETFLLFPSGMVNEAERVMKAVQILKFICDFCDFQF